MRFEYNVKSLFFILSFQIFFCTFATYKNQRIKILKHNVYGYN